MKKSILLMLFTLIIAISLISLFSCNTMTEDSQKLPYFTDIDSGSSNNSGSKPSSPSSTDGNTGTDGNNDVNTDSSIDIDSDIMNDSDSDTDIDIDIDTDSDSPVKQNTIIVFNTDGGNELENISIQLGEDYVLPTPSKNNYKFSGWYFDNDKIDISGKWSIEASKVELIAKWEKQSFTIEYDFNGGKKGSGEFPSEYNSDTKKFQIGRPTRDGNYKFAGWQTADGEITYYYNVKEGSTGDISLKAIWYEYTYTYQDAKGYQYILKDDNTLCVVGYVGVVSNLTIPSSYNDYAVTEIGPYAFCGYGDKIASLQTSGFIRCDIPESVAKISIGAFAGCDDLKVQLYYKSSISVEEWVEKLTIEEQNKHVLDVINGARPAIGWNKYWIPGA